MDTEEPQQHEKRRPLPPDSPLPRLPPAHVSPRTSPHHRHHHHRSESSERRERHRRRGSRSRDETGKRDSGHKSRHRGAGRDGTAHSSLTSWLKDSFKQGPDGSEDKSTHPRKHRSESSSSQQRPRRASVAKTPSGFSALGRLFHRSPSPRPLASSERRKRRERREQPGVARKRPATPPVPVEVTEHEDSGVSDAGKMQAAKQPATVAEGTADSSSDCPEVPRDGALQGDGSEAESLAQIPSAESLVAYPLVSSQTEPMSSAGADDSPEEPLRPPPMGAMPTFTAKYMSNPVPGQWEHSLSTSAAKERGPRIGNMPLEPDEYSEQNVPWIVEQLGMGEQPFRSLLEDNQDDGWDGKFERRRRRKLAFSVLKRRVVEARIGIPRARAPPSTSDYKRSNGTIDYFSYWGNLAKYYADTQLAHKIDYRHDTSDPCKLDRFLLTLQRLVEASAPYQRFFVWLYQLARWDNPKLSAWWCIAYFLVLYLDLLAMVLWMSPVFVIVYYRLRPSQAYQWLGFDRVETSFISPKYIKEASEGTIGKGLIANRLWDIWRETLGTHIQMLLADLADWMERAKNCVTWKRPWATRSLMIVLVVIAGCAYMIPIYVYQKLLGIAVGVEFFFLAPLMIRNQRYRRMLLLPDWLLWHSPTDVELAVEALYSVNPGCGAHSHKSQKPGMENQNLSGAELLRNVANDFIHAYNPLGPRNFPPVMILQTASSTALDHLGDDIEPNADASIIADSRRFAEKLVSKKLIIGSDISDFDDEEYTGISAGQRGHLPSMMEASEEMELFQNGTLRGSRPAVPRAFSLASMSTTDTGSTLPQPFMIARTSHLSNALMPQTGAGRTREHSRTASTGSVAGMRERGSSGVSDQKMQSRFSGGMLVSRAKEISSKLMRKPLSVSQLSGSRTDHDGTATAHTKDAQQDRATSASALSLDGLHHRLSDTAVGRPSISSELSLQSIDSAELAQELDQILERLGSDVSDLSQDDSDSHQFSHSKAKGTGDGIDLTSLYAFRCVHRGKYGTMFVTRDQCIFRRSRILGGRKSSMATYPLSSVVAIRKSNKRFGKSSGIQLLLSDGKSVSFYGLGRRDDVFGFLLIRCGCQHVF